MPPGWSRWWIYQRERFPIFAHGMLIAAFSFCMVAYSALARGYVHIPEPMKTMYIKITDPVILAEQPVLPAFDAEEAEQIHADAHWTFGDAGAVRARCSLWWSDVPQVPGQRVGIIGHYAASSSDVGTQLLQLVCAELAQQGCTLAIGPMDGNTYRSYRFVTERGSEPPFFLEPDNPDDWPEHFASTGFTPLAKR